MKYLPLSIFIAFIFFLFGTVTPIFATAPQITASPSGTINVDQSFTLSATMSGLSKSAVYRLRVAIAQPGTVNYFGSTYDGSNWHMGSINDGNFITVTTDANGSWSGTIQGKVDPDDPNFTTGSGTYDLKLGRYTQTGSTATWSDPVSLILYVHPTPTPTPTPTPIQAVVQSNSQTNAKPTPTPTTTRVYITKLPSIAPTDDSDISTNSSDEEILGEETASVSPEITNPAKPLVKNSGKFGFPLVVFIAGAILLLVGSGTSLYMYYKKKKQDGENLFNT